MVVRSSGIATVGPTGACASLLVFRARLSAKDATHMILCDDLSQHYHAAVDMKKITAKVFIFAIK